MQSLPDIEGIHVEFVASGESDPTDSPSELAIKVCPQRRHHRHSFLLSLLGTLGSGCCALLCAALMHCAALMYSVRHHTADVPACLDLHPDPAFPVLKSTAHVAV